MEATNVEDIGVLGKSPDLGLLQVVKVVVVGGTEIGAEGAVVAGNDGAAAAGGVLGVDTVLDAEAGGLDGIVEGGGVLVVTDAAEVDDAVGGEDVLGATGAVLGGAAGNQLGLVVVEQVLVEGDVLLLGEDGVVGLELVLVEELLVTDSLDVCRMTHIRKSRSLKARERAKKKRPLWLGEAHHKRPEYPAGFFYCAVGGRLMQCHCKKPRAKMNITLHTEERVLQAEKGVFLDGSHFCRINSGEIGLGMVLGSGGSRFKEGQRGDFLKSYGGVVSSCWYGYLAGWRCPTKVNLARFFFGTYRWLALILFFCHIRAKFLDIGIISCEADGRYQVIFDEKQNTLYD